MRYALLASGLVGLAAAVPAPAPQDIDFALAYALPDVTSSVLPDATAQTVTYTPSAIYADALDQITATTTDDMPLQTDTDLQKRATTAASCTALPTGAGPMPTPDTPSDFLANPAYASAALGAQTPSGYTQTFQNLNASNNAYGYLGYTTVQTYDVGKCATKCNSINGCLAFNIYYERDPSVDPGSGTQCPNPPSTINIKCAFWGGPVTAANALNKGQYRNQFQVVIAGSNGYVSNAIASVPGYGTALPLGNAAINAPVDVYGCDSYLGSAIFNKGPFNASLCAQACTEKSNYAIANPPTDGSPVKTCQFFNTYILYINSTSNPANIQGQYCAMYSESWPQKYATNVGQWNGSDHFMIQYSFAYSNATNPGSADAKCAVAQASRDVSYSTLQPFCSAYLGYSPPTSTTTATSFYTPLTTTTIPLTATTTVTPAPKMRRQEDSDPYVVTDIDFATMYENYQGDGADAVASVTDADSAATTTAIEKRALVTPQVLSKYPSPILSSACSLQVTAGPGTTTVSTTATVATSTVTTSSTVTTTTSTVTPTPTPPSSCPKAFTLKINAPGSTFDGLAIAGPTIPKKFVGIKEPRSMYASYSPNVWSFDSTTGLIQSGPNPESYLGWSGPTSLLVMANKGTENSGFFATTCSINWTTKKLSCGGRIAFPPRYSPEYNLPLSGKFRVSHTIPPGASPIITQLLIVPADDPGPVVTLDVVCV